jgi:hypothetical protein
MYILAWFLTGMLFYLMVEKLQNGEILVEDLLISVACGFIGPIIIFLFVLIQAHEKLGALVKWLNTSGIMKKKVF